MKLYEHAPKKDTRRLALLTGAMFLGAAIIMGVTVIFPQISYKWAVQFIGLGLLALGIFFTSRYIMRSYVYRVEVFDEEDGPELTVTEIHGRHVITVCRFTLSSIDEVIAVCPTDRPETDELKRRISADKRKQYNYCVDMFGVKQLCVLATVGGEGIAVRLSHNDELEQLLANNSKTADEQ